MGAGQLKAPHTTVGPLVPSETPQAPGMGQEPKTQTLASRHPEVPFSKTLEPAGKLRPSPPTLTSSQWSLSSCSTRAVCSGVCGTTVDCCEGPRTHGLGPACTWDFMAPSPEPFFWSPMGKPRLREMKEADWSSDKGKWVGHYHASVALECQGLLSRHPPAQVPCRCSR